MVQALHSIAHRVKGPSITDMTDVDGWFVRSGITRRDLERLSVSRRSHSQQRLTKYLAGIVLEVWTSKVARAAEECIRLRTLCSSCDCEHVG